MSVSQPRVFKTEIKDLEAGSPQSESDDQFSDVEKDLKHKMDVTPSRRSQRTADKTFKYYPNRSMNLHLLKMSADAKILIFRILVSV